MITIPVQALLLVSLYTSVSPAPVNPAQDKCATECSGTSSKFRYEVGKAYNYQYETETKVKLAGVSQNEAAIKIEANAQISAIAPCEFSLKLSQVKITGATAADLGSDWMQELGKHVTRFSFDDGEIDEICPKDEEPTWAVNIKRAVLSAFQNAQAGRTGALETYEEDVSGRCLTKFDQKDEGGATVITKTKNLMSCFNRWGNNTAVRLVPYEVRSNIQGHPVIDSKQTCKQTIRGGVLADVLCEEKHILKQANNGDKGGIIGTATQKLHFLNENGNVARGDAGPAEKIYFDHKEIEQVDSKQALQDARQNLKDLCKTNQDGVRPETPSLFNELVYNLRKLSLADLKTLYQESAQAGGCEHGKQCFLNALPMCADTACVSLVAEILKTNYNQLTYMQTRTYFTSLALIPHVTKEMVVSVTPLVGSVTKEGLLGISALVHTYCRENAACGDQPEVKAIVQQLSIALGTKCEAADNSARDAVVYTLKALGNIGHSLEGVEKRVGCLKEKNNPNEIRLAAIQSLRRIPCPTRVQPLVERFADSEEDIEVRLVSFLTFIPCATPEIVNQVKDILEKEQIHQVGSFVRTYFEQMGSSTDPCKVEIQNLLSSQYISKRFNSDPRKYSRFYETSQFSNQWNFGGHAEHALIFTPDGYLPRQGFLNLTLDTFGSSSNLLEIGGRVEGLETLADKLLGPNGYFTNPTGFYFKEKPKPPANPKVVELQEKYGKGIKKHPNLDLALYLRIFGDEVAYKSIRDLDVMHSYTQTMQTMMSSLRAGQEAKVNIARANQLINYYFAIPTISGVPLHFGANGTVALNVEFTGKVDLSKLMKERNAGLHASLNPSAAIERSFIFAIHAGHSKFGVRIQERIHSSTAANINVELKNGEMFKSTLELPKQKNEILQYDYKLFTIKNNIPIEEPGIQKDRVSGTLCTPDRLNKWIGFKICHEAAFANATSVPDAPYFPLTGPVRYAITLEKTDANLKAYEFSAQWKTTPAGRNVKLIFNTPGSSIDRLVSLDYDYQRGKSLAVDFKSPLKKVNAVGTLEMAGAKQTGRINIKVDDAQEYTLVGSQEVQTSGTGRVATYKGEIARPSQQPITISAVDNFSSPPNGMFKRTFDLNAVNMYATPVEFKSVVERTGPRQGTIDYTLKSPKLNAKVSGKITLDGTLGPVGAYRFQEGSSKSEFDWNIEYQKPNVDAAPHKVEIKYLLDYANQGSALKADETIKLKSSRYPAYSVDYKLAVNKSPQQCDVQFSWKDGAGRDIAFGLTSKSDPTGKTSGTATLKSPGFGLDHKMEYSSENKLPSQYAASMKLDTPQTKDVRAEVKYQRSPGGSAEGEAKFSYPGRETRLFKKIQRVDQNKYKSQVIVQWQKDKQVQLDSDVTFDRQNNDYELKTVATGIAAESWTFAKKMKLGNDLSVKSSALLQRGPQTIYDWKLDVSSEAPNKQKIKAQFVSDYAGKKIDLSTDGSVEKTETGRKVIFASKKDQKDFLKGELVIPDIPSRQPATQVKVDLVWDKNAVLLDLQSSNPKPDQIQYDTTFKLELPDRRSPINNKLSVKITRNQVKMVNVTLFQGNAPLLEGGVGYSNKGAPPDKSVAVDLALKTFEPWTKRHLTALGAVKTSTSGLDASLHTENIQEKRKFGIRIAHDGNQAKVVVDAEAYLNEHYVKTKHTYDRTAGDGTRKLNGQIEYNDGGAKKIVHEVSYKATAPMRVAAKLQTPFSYLSDFEGNLDLNQQANQGGGHKSDVKGDLKWNQNQNLKFQMRGDNTPATLALDVTLQSSIAGLKSGQLALKCDSQKGRDFDMKLDWNDVNKLRLHQQRVSQQSGDESWSAGVEAVVPNTMNYNISSDLDWNANTGKYKANTESQFNGAAYKMLANFDTKSQEGTIDITTPNDQLKDLKAKVTKVGDNEYELKVVQNAQSVADVKAALKLDANKQKVSVEAKNIQKPFKMQLEREASPERFLIGGEFSAEPQDPKKTYGMKLLLDKAADGGRAVDASLSYPARQLRINYNMLNQLPAKYNFTAEIRANAAQPGTKMQVNIALPGPAQVTYGFHINKENLGGIQLDGTYQQVGECSRALEPCSISGESSLRYSNDPNKALTYKFKLNREIVQQRPKYSYELEKQHQATKLLVKHYVDVLVAPCQGRRQDCKRTVEAGLALMDKQGQTKVYKYKYETDSFRTSSAELTCPSAKWARMVYWDGEQLKASLKRDDRPLYELIAGYDRSDKEYRVEVKDAATQAVIIHLGARKPSADAVELQLWHSQNAQKVEDVSVILALKENSRVRSRLFVRPGFKDDFGNYLKTQWDQAVAATHVTATGGESPFVHTVQARQAIRDDIAASLKPLLEHWQQQQDTIGRELGFDLSAVRSLGSNLVNAVRNSVRPVQNIANDLIARITSAAPSQTIQKLIQDVQDYVTAAVADGRIIVASIGQSLQQAGASISEMISSWSRIRDDLYKDLRINELTAYLRSVYGEIMQNPVVQQIVQFLSNIRGSLPDMSLDGIQTSAGNIYNETNRAISDTQQQVGQQASAWWQHLLKNEDTKAIAGFLQEAYNRLVFHMSRMGPSDKVVGMYQWITQEFQELTTAGGLAKRYLPSVKESMPEKGIYVVEATIPGDYKSMDEIASKLQVDRLQQLGGTVTDRWSGVARDADYAVRDAMLQFHPSQAGVNFGSPLASTAILAGDQHFITFDGEEYDFAGECDYLLARDFDNGEFTITVNFERRQNRVARKSVTVQYLENKVEISYDNQVKINDKATDLPWQSMNDETKDVTLAVSRHDHIVTVAAVDGLLVRCDSYYHVCRITVPRRYHGKSGGLLGTNDFEPYNELTRPDRKRTANVAEFAREWTTSASCAVSDNQAGKGSASSGQLYEECRSLLNSSSSHLRLCFHRLPPTPFLNMCLIEAAQPAPAQPAQAKRVICNAVAAYIEACLEEGVALDLPSQCVQCDVAGTTLSEDETKRLEGQQVPNYADVIFMVEERTCMAWTKAQLPTMAQSIEGSLKQQGYDVRFGLVSFNGEGAHYHPHFHTGQGALSLNVAGIQAAAAQLAFSTRERRRFQDPLVAIKFAADHFPFRAGTRKLLTLYACEECGGTEVGYFDLQSELLQMAVSLQMITSAKIELSNPGAPEIIALDAKTMYGADLSEKPDLRPQLVEPHDSCTVLTQETNGTVISYSEKNVASITQLVSRKLVSAVSGPKCQICECQEHEHAPRTVCFPCEIPRPASLTSDSTGFFNNPFVRLQKWQKKAQDTLNRGLTPTYRFRL